MGRAAQYFALRVWWRLPRLQLADLVTKARRHEPSVDPTGTRDCLADSSIGSPPGRGAEAVAAGDAGARVRDAEGRPITSQPVGLCSLVRPATR